MGIQSKAQERETKMIYMELKLEICDRKLLKNVSGLWTD
jgi:hypothetical protein